MLNLNQLKKLYTNSPLWLQKIYAFIPHDIRNGAEYRRWQNFLQENISTKEYQLLKIKETILYAYENTDYYKKTYSALDISPFDIKTIQDVSKLPVIDKSIVKKYFFQLCAKNFSSSNTFYVTTGGTSGTPMKFLQSNNVWKKELAFNINYFSQYGYSPSDLKASFRGGTFDRLPQNQYWKYNPINHEIHFSPFHINEHTVQHYVKKLNRVRPKFFHSYPSSLLSLIAHMENRHLSLNYKPKTIFLISENFTNEDSVRISTFFQCTISSFYGHSERLIFAPNHSDTLDAYKVDSRYGLCELIDSNNNIITTNQLEGELVGSSFDNFAMPLIRYRTEDFAHYIDTDQKILSPIKGRWSQDFFLGKHKEKIYLTALNMHSDVFKNVQRYQFCQLKPGTVTLCIVPTKLFQKIDSKNIVEALKSKVGHTLSFQIKLVDQLQLTKRGKFKKIMLSKELLETS